MRAGPLRKRVTIQSASYAKNASGESIATWNTHARVWMSLEPLSGDELVAAEKIQSNVTHKAKMRYLSTLTPDMRFTYDSRTFQIVEIRNMFERNREMHLICGVIDA
jgi:SPP1 family predicted phage head-tail adaptor